MFDRIDFISYLTRIRNKDWSNVFIPYYLFYKIDVALEWQLPKLHASTGTAAVFTGIMNYFRLNGIWLP